MISLSRARRIIHSTFEAWREQNKIMNWMFFLDYIKSIYPSIGNELEHIMNKLYGLRSQGYDFDRQYIWFTRESSSEQTNCTLKLEEHPRDIAEK